MVCGGYIPRYIPSKLVNLHNHRGGHPVLPPRLGIDIPHPVMRVHTCPVFNRLVKVLLNPRGVFFVYLRLPILVHIAVVLGVKHVAGCVVGVENVTTKIDQHQPNRKRLGRLAKQQLTSPQILCPFCKLSLQFNGRLFDGPVLLALDNGELNNRRFPDLPSAAAVIPIQISTKSTSGFLILGINPRRPLDRGYKLWLESIRKELAAAATGVWMRQQEFTRIIEPQFVPAVKRPSRIYP